MGTILRAPERAVLGGPLVFLAGPIAWGAEAWQDRAIELIRALDTRIHIANPRRDVDTSGDFNDADYAEQVDWETEHLRRAGRCGVVLFWLARERVHRCVRPHAQTTRFELAEWKERHARDGANLVVGIEDGFTGARYIRRRFAQDCPRVPLCSSLEETCRVTAEVCRASLATAA